MKNKKIIFVIVEIIILLSVVFNVFASDIKDDIQNIKEYITEKKNSAPASMKTGEIFVKAMQDDKCLSIVSEALKDFKYDVVKQYKISGAYFLRFASIEEADAAVDILNARDDIKFAEPDYRIMDPFGKENLINSKPVYINPKTYEISVLNANGIIVGDPDGNLRGNDGITRAEFAAVLCRAMGREAEAGSEEIKQKNYFPDVSSEHWASGYVNFAYENGAISGFPDGNFYPEQSVTNEQVIKMLIAAWGYGDEAEQNGGYPNGYIKVAKEHGVLDTVECNYANASKRWVASIFVYGVMSMPSKNKEIKPPIKTKPITVDEPRVEKDDYVERP